MKATKLFGIGAMALAFAGWMNVANVSADERVAQPSLGDVRSGSGEEALVVESIGFATGIDVFELRCTQATTRCARADVRDIGPFNDTHFSVSIVGVTPPVQGRADYQVSPVGGLSPLAQICRPTNGTMTSYVLIAEANLKGFENYDSLMTCVNAVGATTNHTVTLKQDE